MENKIVAVVLLVACSSLQLVAMEKVSKEHRSKLANSIKQIEFAHEVGPEWFGSNDRISSFMNEHIDIVGEVLEENSLSYGKRGTVSWLNDIKRDLQKSELAMELSKQKKQPNVHRSDNDTCDISGLPKKDVLSVLFLAAVEKGAFSDVVKLSLEQSGRTLPENYLSEADFESASKCDWNIDYLHGKPMKVNLSGDSFNARLYNRDQGEGCAQEAIKALRENLKH